MSRSARPTRPAFAVGVASATVAVLLAGCGGSGGSGDRPTSNPPTAPATSTSSSSSTTPTAAAESSGATTSPTGSASVPAPLATGSTGRRVPLVRVSVAGGPAVRVVLDTGSTGLVLRSADVGSQAKPTGRRLDRSYVGFSLTGSVSSAPVSVLGPGRTFTTSTVDVGVVTSPLTSFLESVHADGILGVAPGRSPDSAGLFSPLAALPRPLADGYLIDTKAGSLQLGAPHIDGAGEAPLTKADWSYPNGLPGYDKTVALQWMIGTRHVTLPTVVDTGGGDGFYPRTLLPADAVDGMRLRAGTQVALTAGGRTLLRYVAGRPQAPQAAVSTSQQTMNSGERAFENARIGIDLSSGRFVVAPY